MLIYINYWWQILLFLVIINIFGYVLIRQIEKRSGISSPAKGGVLALFSGIFIVLLLAGVADDMSRPG